MEAKRSTGKPRPAKKRNFCAVMGRALRPEKAETAANQGTTIRNFHTWPHEKHIAASRAATIRSAGKRLGMRTATSQPRLQCKQSPVIRQNFKNLRTPDHAAANQAAPRVPLHSAGRLEVSSGTQSRVRRQGSCRHHAALEFNGQLFRIGQGLVRMAFFQQDIHGCFPAALRFVRAGFNDQSPGWGRPSDSARTHVGGGGGMSWWLRSRWIKRLRIYLLSCPRQGV